MRVVCLRRTIDTRRRLRDAGKYIDPTINRTARLRDLGHGGQTLLSGVTAALTEDQLQDASLADLGTHVMRGLPRPERVVQSSAGPPRPRTCATLLPGDRLVTVTGAGGSGKIRLAVHVASQVVADYTDGIWYVDLAPIANPDVVPATAARAFGLADQPGYSATETLLRFVGDRRLLVVLDNCQHLLSACAEMIIVVLEAGPGVTVLATSREPLGVPGEAVCQVPSLSLADEAVELFADRARLVRTDCTVTADNAATVEQIGHRLDGMPRAIEFAAARVRALSLSEILGGLHDRFRLLTGSARTAVRRQQTLRASVDWSHALLGEPERAQFRRLAVFLGGFDLKAARSVAADDVADHYQLLDQLSLLVHKSLVVAESTGGRTRYRLLETVRQYALERLAETGAGDAVRRQSRRRYNRCGSTVAVFEKDWPGLAGCSLRSEGARVGVSHLRRAYGAAGPSGGHPGCRVTPARIWAARRARRRRCGGA